MMGRLSKYFCYVYLFLWIVYNLQEILQIRGLVSQMIVFSLLLISACITIEVNLRYKTGPYFRCLNVMLILSVIYGVIVIVGDYSFHKGIYSSNIINNYSYLQRILGSVLPIYVFYYFTLKNQITSRDMIVIFAMLLIYSVLMLYQKQFSLLEDSVKEEVTNNKGYNFVPLIPLLYLVKIKDIWKYFILIVIAAYIIMTFKRGAMLAGTVMMSLFLLRNLKAISVKRVFYLLLLTLIVIFGIYRFLTDFYARSAYLQARLASTMEGNTSGREQIYRIYYDYFAEHTSAFEFLFGHGANGTILLFHQYAHNDWLEFAINQGVLGVVLYAVY